MTRSVSGMEREKGRMMRFRLTTAAKALRHLAPLSNSAKLKLHDPAQVRALIGREQARAARRRRPLSVVLFRASNRLGRSALVRLLLRRARETDSIGVLDAERLCAVLADTDAAGASRYAEQLHKLAATQGIVIEEMVHTTPIPAASGRDAEEAAAQDVAWLDAPDAALNRHAPRPTRRTAMTSFRELMDWLAGSTGAATPEPVAAKSAAANSNGSPRRSPAGSDDEEDLADRLAGANSNAA
jgi:hypothetical protein